MPAFDADYIIVGSGFGGSVAALRLVEKGYRVRMLEKGSELTSSDFPRSNWNLKRWLWIPALGFRGLFRMSFFRHLTVLSGVGVGGGSLVYACTHPVPKPDFFRMPSWAHLADWQQELAPHYAVAQRMLGVTPNPTWTEPDLALRDVARARGHDDAVEPTRVAIHFGTPGVTVDDPYFDGQGPTRTGCIRCGGCMLGCRYNAKNSLDKNYLYLARRRGLELDADTEVTAVRPRPEGGYVIEARQGRHPWARRTRSWTAQNVILAGGVLGTVALLLKMKHDPQGLPALSSRVGRDIRTNSEALIGVISRRTDVNLSEGIAIGSVYQIDDTTHMEPVRYPAGSGFFRLLMAPHVAGRHVGIRLLRLLGIVVRHPLKLLRAMTVADLSRQTTILLYMRTSEGLLRLRRSWLGRIITRPESGPPPTASMPEATALAQKVATRLDGMPVSLVTETLFNIPSTAHILGGSCMGESAASGVIDADHRVFGYHGLHVMDGSAVSANPGVNPSLTIVAMTERAVAKIANKQSQVPTASADHDSTGVVNRHQTA